MSHRKILLLLACTLYLLAGGREAATAQPVKWGLVLSASYHVHDYESPLDFWDNAGLVFPALALRTEVPFSFVDGPLGEKLFLYSGIRYTRLASRIDWESGTANGGETFAGRFRIGQHYLAVPLQFRLALGNTPVSILAGPEFGFLLFARKVSDTLSPAEFRSSQTEGVGDDLNRVNVSLGGGVVVRLAGGLRATARYNAGLSNAKKSPERTVLVSDWTTKEFELGIEFIFNARKDP